jgi:hypothetical protein
MPKNLLIVESPAKAKTIEKILGKDFEVKSCYGHIRDLEKAGMGIDIEKNYKPTYIVPPEKQKVVNDLKKLSKDLTRFGWQRMRTAKVRLSVGIYVKCLVSIPRQQRELFSMRSLNLPFKTLFRIQGQSI